MRAIKNKPLILDLNGMDKINALKSILQNKYHYSDKRLTLWRDYCEARGMDNLRDIYQLLLEEEKAGRRWKRLS